MSDASGKDDGTQTRQLLLRADVWPYLLGFAAVVAMLCICKAFWLTNDDVQMSLIADGQGLAAVPSPHLVLTNIVWGYLVYWFPDIGGIRSYAWITYAAFALAYAAMVLAFRRSTVDHRLAAAALVLVFVPALIRPQFTLVAGYLAAAGLLLGCVAVDGRSVRLGVFAGGLLVMSGLVRADETLLVMLVASPLCIASAQSALRSELRSRWLAIAGVSAALFLGFQVLDYLTFSAGPWALYGSNYALRTGFTDFGLSAWFTTHPASLAGSIYSVNDMHLLTEWFYLDTQVFSTAELSRLLDQLPWLGRVHVDYETMVRTLEPFTNASVNALCAMLAALLLFHRKRRALFAALVLFAVVMLCLAMAGRPGVTRIYFPVFVALVVLGVIQLGECRRWVRLVLLLVACMAAFIVCHHLYDNDRHLQGDAQVAQSATCDLPRGKLWIVWAGHYPFPLEYPVFQPKQYDCPFDYYSFGQFALAPFALDRLHAFTGGKDFVPALLGGRSFQVIADREQLFLLRNFLHTHYDAKLSITEGLSNPHYAIYTIAIAPPTKAALRFRARLRSHRHEPNRLKRPA